MKANNSWLDRIYDSIYYKHLIQWLKVRTLPGFYQVSLYDTLRVAWKEAILKDIFTRSYGVAYAVFISLFPFIIVILSIISFFPERKVLTYVDKSIHGIMPLNAEKFILNTVQAIIDTPRSGLLSVGFLIAIFFASTAVLTLIRGFDKNYDLTYKSRSWIKERLVAIGITLLIGVLLIVSIGLIMVGDFMIQTIIGKFGYGKFLAILLISTKWIVIVFALLTVMGIIYRFGPAMKQKFVLFSPGAIISTIFCLLTSLGFSIFVNNFGTYNKVYGSIGATIVTMVWIQLNCLIILLGYEINASIALNRDHKRIGSTDLHPPSDQVEE